MEALKQVSALQIYNTWVDLLPKETLLLRGVYSIHQGHYVYVGMTTNSFKARIKKHVKDLCRGEHHCRALQELFDGSAKFYFTVDFISSSPELIAIEERKTWESYKAKGRIMLNSSPNGRGSVFHSVATKTKISNTLKEKRRQAEDSLYRRKNEVEELALNPFVTQIEAAELLNVSRSVLQRFVVESQIDWVHSTVAQKTKAKLNQNKTLIEKLASDPKVSTTEASKLIKVPRVHLLVFLKDEEIRWVFGSKEKVLAAPESFINDVREGKLTRNAMLVKYDLSTRSFYSLLDDLALEWKRKRQGSSSKMIAV